MPASKRSCLHSHLQTTPSPHADDVGYKTFSTQQLFTAATGSWKNVTRAWLEYAEVFPAPMVLPGSELSHDPKYPPQSFKSWLNLNERNRLAQDRDVVYVAGAPGVSKGDLGFVEQWKLPRKNALPKTKKLVPVPAVDKISEYLQAFFHGLPVKKLPSTQEWTAWEEARAPETKPVLAHETTHIGLACTMSGIQTRVRVRHLNGSRDFSAYPAQLNLNDILDHLIAVLPEDAYCVILIVDYDLYEDDEDDFCCGRAYGSSRISVVSTAQYQPALDQWHGLHIRQGHWWPGSHCRDYVNRECGMASNTACPGKRRRVAKKDLEHFAIRKKQRGPSPCASEAIVLELSMVKETGGQHDVAGDSLTPLRNAVDAQRACLKRALSEADLRSLYLQRLSLTASHELLHCFGFGHCVYYACAMQGTSSMIEDSQQPPYLCPVCEHKLAWVAKSFRLEKPQATVMKAAWWEERAIQDWRKARHEAIVEFCQTRGNEDLGFASLASWTTAILGMSGARQI